MKTLCFSSKKHDREYFSRTNEALGLQIDFQEARLTLETVPLCKGYDYVCVFVNDQLNSSVLDKLKNYGVRHIALRCAGFNNVNLEHCKALGISVSRVPAYSPEAVAEHTIALMMTLNRKTHKSFNRVRENNFSLDGLVGFNFHGKTVGVVGSGKIGRCVINILHGMGCNIFVTDPYPDASISQLHNVDYTTIENLLERSDIITLHCPLTSESQHLVNEQSIAKMKDNVMLINTSRGGLIDSKAVIEGLKKRKIGYLGLDVYEMESELFFEDKSWEIMQDEVFDRLVGFPNVLITGHQGFFTHEALQQIALTTLRNIKMFNDGKKSEDTFLV